MVALPSRYEIDDLLTGHLRLIYDSFSGHYRTITEPLSNRFREMVGHAVERFLFNCAASTAT
jgi:hypothetical protein